MKRLACSQCAFFRSKYLILVYKCTKCVRTKKYAEMQRSIHMLKTIQKLSVQQRTLQSLNSPSYGHNSVSELANVGILFLANLLPPLALCFNQAQTWCCACD